MLLTFPWHVTAQLDPNRKCLALLGLVHLQSPLLLPTFLQFGIRIERQLRRTSGVLGFRTAADPMSLKFYHLSAWHDKDAIDLFVRSAPHAFAVRRLIGRLGVTAFRYWEVQSSELPLEIRRELQRLSTAAT